MKHRGVLTNAVTKPTTYDKEGVPKTEGYLAITLKFELDDFTDEELGGLLLNLARGKQVDVQIDALQMHSDGLLSSADGE